MTKIASPTQMLLVEITDDEASALRCEEGGPGFSCAVRNHKQAVLAKLRTALSQPEQRGKDEAEERLQEAEARIAELERGCCDVYAYLRQHDVGAAKIRLLSLGALPE